VIALVELALQVFGNRPGYASAAARPPAGGPAPAAPQPAPAGEPAP
jgi:hypothetical protein